MKALRIVAYILLAAVVIVVNVTAVGFLVLKTNRARNFLVAFGVRKLHPIFPGGAKVASSSGDLTRGVVLNDVELDDLDGRPAVHVDRLEVKYSLLSLLLTRVQVDLVGVEGVTIYSRPLLDGRDNLATMAKIDKPLPKPPRALPISVMLQELDVDARFVRGETEANAKLYARAQLSHGMVASLDDLRIDVAQPARATITAQGGLHIAPEPGDMDVRHVSVRVDSDTTALRRKVEKLELRGPVVVYATANGKVHDLVATVAIDTTQPRVRVRGDAHLYEDRAELHELTVRSPFALVDAHGAYHFDQTGEGVVHVDAPDLRPLALFGAPPMSGSVKLDADARRREGHVVAHATGLVRELRVANNRIGRVTLDVDAEDLSGHAFVQADHLLLGAVNLDIAKIDAAASERAMHVAVDAHGPEGLDFVLDVNATPTMRGKRMTQLVATLDKLRFRAGGTPWKLDGPAHVNADFEHDRYALSPLGLNNDQQHITLEGQLDRKTLANVHVDVKHFDIQQLPALLSPGHVLPRTDVQLQAEASGPLAQPNVGAKFEGTGDGRTQHDLIHFTANGSARLQKGRLNAKAFATIGGQRTSAKVDMPLPLKPNQPIDASVDASVLMLPVFADLLVPKIIQSQPILLYTLGTKVMVQGSLTGTTSEPTIKAAARAARWGTDNAHGDLAASFEYKQKTLRVSTTLTLSKLPLGGGKAAGLVQATTTLPLDITPALSGEGVPALDSYATWTGSLDLHHVDIEKLPFEGLNIVPFVRHGWVDATATLSGSRAHPKAKVNWNASDLDVVGITQVAFRGEGNLDGDRAVAHADLSVRKEQAARAEASINASSTSWSDAPIAASIDARGFALDKLQLFKELTGTFKAQANVTGSIAHPKVVASVSIPDLRSGKTTYRAFDAHAQLANGQLDGDLKAVQTDGAELVAKVDSNRGGLHGVVNATRFRVDATSELLPRVRELHAQLDGHVLLGGTFDVPRFDGSMVLSRGDLVLAQSAITYKDVNATLVLTNNDIAIEKINMSAGTGGVLDGDLRLALRDLRAATLRGKLYLHHYPVEWSDTTGTADASLLVDGHRDQNAFTTRVTIQDGSVELRDDRTIHGLIPTARLEDVKVGTARPQPITPVTPKLGARHGDAVELDGTFMVHGHELEAQATANVRVDLSSDIATATGSLTLTPHGSVRLFGQRYDLVRGRVLFGNIAQPNVDFRLSRAVSHAHIGVDIGGSALQPLTTFWADPAEAYPPAKVASLITGQHEEKDGVAKKGIDRKVDGPISNLIAVSFRQNDPASSIADVNKPQPIPDASKNKQ